MLQSLAQLLRELLVAIQALTPYSGPTEAPELIRLPAAELQALVCGEPCGVLGWYSPEGVIYLAAELDIEHDLLARSILLHELVHHVQRTKRGGDAADCREWIEREDEAKRVQYLWLAKSGWRGRSSQLRMPFTVCLSDQSDEAD